MAIRPDNDPRSAAQRPGAPKGELEQYGVWVKAEPQDIVEEAPPQIEDADFDLPGGSVSLPEESFLSEDEEKLLGAFDADFEAEPNQGGLSPSFELGPLPDIEDMPSLDELGGEHEVPPLHLDMSIDFDTIEGLDSSTPSTAAPEAAPTRTSATAQHVASNEMEDVSSDFLDLPAEASPAARPAPKPASPPPTSSAPASFDAGIDDVTAEFLDIEEKAPSSQSPEALSDFETLDIDLHFDDTLPSTNSSAASSANSDFEEVTEFDDFLSPDSEAKAELSEEIPGSAPEGPASFDDVSAVEKELAAEPKAAVHRIPPSSQDMARPSPAAQLPEAPTVAAAVATKPDLSTEILLKIAEELASIRGELVSLKTQLGAIKAEPEIKPLVIPIIEEEKEEAQPGGFFDEEEDETIALTGDELDNILNTADFSEEIVEAGAPEEIETESLIPEAPTDMSMLSEDLLPETGDYSAPPVHAIDMEISVDEGVTPMTPAPDDTSYLESESANELISAPINDIPLVEPDLSDFDLESEDLDLQARPEIEEELPLVDSRSEVLEDISFESEALSEISSDEQGEEAEYLEPMPEIEEKLPVFDEISLHDESSLSSSQPMEAEGFIEVEEVASEEPFEIEDIGSIEEAPFATEMPGKALDSEDRSLKRPPSPFAEAPSFSEPEAVVEAWNEPDEPEVEEKENAPEPSQPETLPEIETPARIDAAPTSAPEKKAEDGDRLKSEIRSVLSYLDKLLDSLPEEKIEEFARSEYFDTYKRLFEELGLV